MLWFNMLNNMRNSLTNKSDYMNLETKQVWMKKKKKIGPEKSEKHEIQETREVSGKREICIPSLFPSYILSLGAMLSCEYD